MSRATELYEISTRLAVGDAGLVYRAKDRASGRTVALKLLLAEEQIAHPLDVESLLRDAPELSRITGANIVQLLDAFADEDGTVLVYEFAEGTRGLDVPGVCPIPAEQALDVAAQLLAALRSGERQRYPHGDLKPSDISLVRLADGRPLVMVLDWGLANYRKEPTPEALAYTAPERLAGEPPSHGADLFSAGAVLHYLFTGHRLAEGATKDEFAAAWQSLNPATLGALRPDLSSGLVEWIARLLQPDVSQRPPSAVEALTALAALNPPLPPAVPETIRPRPARPQPQPVQSAIQPRPVAQSSAAAASPASPAAPAPAVSRADEARRELARLQKRKQSLTLFTIYFVALAALGFGGFAIWKKTQADKKRRLADDPSASSPSAISSELPKAAPAERQDPASATEAPAKTAAAPSATAATATFSSSPNPPPVDPTDVANLAAQAATDKWFFASEDENNPADAAKGLTFTTGDAPVLFKALTYKIAAPNKKAATLDTPTTWTIRLGTLAGANFTPIATAQAQQTVDTGDGDFITWTLATPVPLGANTAYAVDVAMFSRTAWRTGIPYLSCSKNVTAPGVGAFYHSGDLGVGGATISPDESIDRIFHVDLQSPSTPGAKPQPPRFAEVPASKPEPPKPEPPKPEPPKPEPPKPAAPSRFLAREEFLYPASAPLHNLAGGDGWTKPWQGPGASIASGSVKFHNHESAGGSIRIEPVDKDTEWSRIAGPLQKFIDPKKGGEFWFAMSLLHTDFSDAPGGEFQFNPVESTDVKKLIRIIVNDTGKGLEVSQFDRRQPVKIEDGSAPITIVMRIIVQPVAGNWEFTSAFAVNPPVNGQVNLIPNRIRIAAAAFPKEFGICLRKKPKAPAAGDAPGIARTQIDSIRYGKTLSDVMTPD